MTQPATIYLSLETRDTKGTGGLLYAAHRSGQFILFDVNDGTAQVLFLEKAAEPGDVPRVVFQRLTDVKHAKQIRDELVPAMLRARGASDALEAVIPADLWPLPTYREMLFIR